MAFVKFELLPDSLRYKKDANILDSSKLFTKPSSNREPLFSDIFISKEFQAKEVQG